MIGSIIGVRWSLALSALVLAAITCLLLWIWLRKEGPTLRSPGWPNILVLVRSDAKQGCCFLSEHTGTSDE
jgi:hypothetical protein